MEINDVTVIIPSYNRAHLLSKTIPTYFQKGVKQVIIVDDCSKDNTQEEVEKLQKEYSGLKYIRQLQNKRQPAANNRGLENVSTEWVYFGDDDSILCPNSIEYLKETAKKYNADIVGARALYMQSGDDCIPLVDAIEKYDYLSASDLKDLVDVETLQASFNKKYPEPVEVPFCHACLLMKADLAKKVRFDVNYIGNAYREETDFIVRCTKEDARVFFDSRAIQFNLPSAVATGGARGKSMWRYKRDCIRNNWYFLKKNWKFLREKYDIRTTAVEAQIRFASGYFIRPLKRLFKYGRLKG